MLNKIILLLAVFISGCAITVNNSFVNSDNVTNIQQKDNNDNHSPLATAVTPTLNLDKYSALPQTDYKNKVDFLIDYIKILKQHITDFKKCIELHNKTPSEKCQ